MNNREWRMELSNWTILSLIDRDFAAQIRLACVFGNLGNEALLVTRDDKVYALGSNGAGCLGQGDMHSSLHPKPVEDLCYKKVIGFAYGSGPHVLAFTESGELYSWGHNGYCQLGNGSTNQGLTPSLIQNSLTGKRVVSVSCGSHHSLCLTSDGDIFSWGQNNCGQIGSGNTTNQSTPRKVTASFGGRKVVGVTCGQTSSMAVLENGEVYGWGYNGNGQLGLGNNINQLNPCRVTALQGVVITSVVCGYAHTLAISDEGALYSWGANSYGQLGTGNKANSCTPTRVGEELGRIVEIAATHYNHISSALTQKTQCYMWGQCRGQSVVSPTLTPFSALHDVFACFATPSVTFVPMETEITAGPNVYDSLKQAFDDSSTSDVRFLVENREIHAHKAVLKIRCEHFRSMFQEHWEEGSSMQGQIDIRFFTYPVYRAFLQYLYTDQVDLLPEDAIGLLDLANSYCEGQLKRRCERIIRQGITVDNVAMLYATAIKYQAKELEDFCFKFSLNHMTAVTQTTAFAKLDESTLKDFISKAAKNGAFKS